MEFKKILEINKGLIKLKDDNKKFNIKIAKKLIYNLKLTNYIVDEQNNRLTKLLTDIGKFDGYDYIIDDDTLKAKYDELNNEDINCDLVKLRNEDVDNCLFDLTTIEILLPIIECELNNKIILNE